MTSEQIQFILILLTITGGFISLLLAVNAYFLRDLNKSLAEVKLELGKLYTEHSIYSALVQKHETELDRARERLHTLEGAYAQFDNYLKSKGDYHG